MCLGGVGFEQQRLEPLRHLVGESQPVLFDGQAQLWRQCQIQLVDGLTQVGAGCRPPGEAPDAPEPDGSGAAVVVLSADKGKLQRVAKRRRKCISPDGEEIRTVECGSGTSRPTPAGSVQIPFTGDRAWVSAEEKPGDEAPPAPDRPDEHIAQHMRRPAGGYPDAGREPAAAEDPDTTDEEPSS